MQREESWVAKLTGGVGYITYRGTKRGQGLSPEVVLKCQYDAEDMLKARV